MSEYDVETSAAVVLGLSEKAPVLVLQVDDDAEFLKVAKECLEMEGEFQVETALSVKEAWKKMREKRFDAVVCDYLMPGKDGLQFLKELRGSGNTIPFIMFTGKGREEVAIKALNLGADQYINKHGNPETVYSELAYAIRKVVKARMEEDALRESEERYRILVESSSDGIVIVQGVEILFVNSTMLKMFGCQTENDMVGHKFTEFVSPEDRNMMLERGFAREKGEHMPSHYEFKALRKDGTEFYANLSVNVIAYRGRVARQGIIRDITERKKAQEALRESEEKYRRLFENAPNLILTLDLEGNITAANHVLQKYGYDKNEIIGKNVFDVISEEYWQQFRDEFKDLAQGRSVEGEIKIRSKRKRQGYIIAEYRSSPIIVGGKVIGVQTILRDTTEQKKAEERLRESERFSFSLLENSPHPIIVINPDTSVRYVNPALKKLTGFSSQELIGRKAPYPWWTKETLEKINGEFKKILSRGATGVEERFQKKNGERFWVKITSVPIIRHGKYECYLASWINITERKEIEEKLRMSEEKYRRLFEDSTDGLVIIDRENGSILDCNQEFVRQTGRDKDQLLKMKIWDIRPPQLREAARKKFLEIRDRGQGGSMELDFQKPSGEIVKIDFLCRATKIGNREVLQSRCRDITEHIRMEKSTQEGQEKFERLFMGNPEAAVYVDLDFQVLNVNPRFTELFGYALEEAKGRHINDLVVPEDKMGEAEGLDKKAGKGYSYLETVRKRKDGSLVPVSISAAPITAEGRLIGYVALYKDITARKRAEKELKEAMRNLATLNEKLHVVGRLTRHDVRNKLSTVTGNVYLAKQKLPRDHEVFKHLREIEAAVGQMVRIFDFARAYERLGVEKLVYVNVERAVRGAVSLFSDLHDVEVVNDCRGLSVLADSLLRQLFYNLIDNSLKYGEKVSRIRVYYKEAGKDRLRLIYEDDGVGVPKAEKEKIFKEGYGRGTGYGLYLIRKTCEVYGWRIQETGKHGKGARFTITIPRTNSSGKTLYKLHRS